MTFVYDLTLEQWTPPVEIAGPSAVQVRRPRYPWQKWLAAAITALPGAGIAQLLATDDDDDE